MEFSLLFRAIHPLPLTLYSIVFLVFSAVVYLVIDSWRAGLSHIPGPWVAKYTDAWSAYQAKKNIGCVNKADQWRNLQEKYGRVVRIGPRTVVVLDCTAVPTIYGVKNRLNKGPAYIPFQQPGVTTNLLSIPDDTTHSRYRKLVSNAYALSSLKGYEPYLDEMINRFVAVCDRHAQTQAPLNLSLWCHYYAFDVVSKLTFGKAFGFMNQKGRDVLGLIAKTRAHGKYITWVANIPWLHKVIVENPVMRSTKPSPFTKAAQDAVVQRLKDFKASGDDLSVRPDLLSHFVAAHLKDPQTMDAKQMVIFCASNLVAGGLTPGRVFDYLCHWLALHPEAQERIHHEVTDANVSIPASYDSVKNLPYLDGVVREAYRAHSSANLSRVIGEGGLEMPWGTHLPAGTQISCPQAAVAEDPQLWGQDFRIWTEDGPSFHPENWMRRDGESEAEFVERRRVIDRTELVFGQGSRICLGKNIASLEIYKMVATIMLLFRFEIIGKPKSHEVFVRVHSRN